MAGRLLNSFIPNRGGRQFLKCSYQDISFVSSGTRSPPESDFDIIERVEDNVDQSAIGVTTDQDFNDNSFF